MFNLILKDIILLKKTILVTAVYVIFFIFVFQKTGAASFPAGMVAISYILIISGCAYESKNNSDLMLNSLPIPRSRIVAAKYLSIFVYLGLGIIIYLVIIRLFSLAKLPLQVFPLSVEGLVAALFAVSFLNSIYLPLFFKFGYLKSKIVNLFMFLLVFFGMTNLANLFAASEDKAWVKTLLSFSKQTTNLQVALGIIIVALVLLLSSYFISLKFYQNREF